MSKFKASLFICGFIIAFAISGCMQSEKTKVLNTAVDIICATKEMTLTMQNIDSSDDAMNELARMDEEINQIIKNHGFKNMDEFEELAEKYEKDSSFQNEKIQMTLQKCNFEI